MTERDVDAELVARVKAGDKKAFDLLVLKYQRKIMRLLSRMIRDQAEVEDVAQEAFIKAYRALPQFRGYEDIAQSMNCPIGTVRSRIFRAREAIATKLRPMMTNSGDRRW